MARTIRILSINEFKELVGTENIHVKMGATGSYYAVDENSRRVASVASDVLDAVQSGKPLVVLELEELGDRWYMIVPAKDSQPDIMVL